MLYYIHSRTTTPNVFFSATEPEADGLNPNGGHQKNGDFHYASSDLRSDRNFENVRPIRMPPKSSLVLNVLMIFVVSFTFGETILNLKLCLVFKSQRITYFTL